MTLADTFFFKIFEEIIANLEQYFLTVHEALYSDFGMFARALTGLYLAVFCIGGMLGYFKDHTKEILLSCFLVVCLHSFLVEGDSYIKLTKGYKNYIIKTAGFFGSEGKGESMEDMFSQFSKIGEKVMTFASENSEEMSIFKLGLAKLVKPILAGILILLFFLIITAYLVLCCLSVFAIYFFFLIGPLPIFLASFKETRFVFNNWLRSLLCDSLIIIFASVVISIGFGGLSNYLQELVDALAKSGNILDAGYLTVFFWGAIIFALLLKTADFASAITGGNAGSTAMIAGGIAMGAGSIARQTFSSATNNPATRFAGETVGQGGRRLWEKAKNIRK